MATKPTLTDAEAAAEMDALMDRLRTPDEAEELVRIRKSARTAEEMLAILEERLRTNGSLGVIDEDFARDVEEGRRLAREGARDWE